MSCNREQFSRESRDVLYNVDSEDHFFDWFIFELTHDNVIALNSENITFQILHKPTQCMYPHSEIVCNRYDVELNEIPEEFKTRVRQKLQSISEIVKK